MANSIFMFLSRHQIECLEKLGPLSTFLCEMFLKDLARKSNELLMHKFENEEIMSQSQNSSDMDMLKSQITSALRSELSILMSP